ncbi:hypothetical protein EWM64_g5683 [Hericium alpestre]|uniref:Uncharacterized protein n=1 Tax=Hericium alpestre TaxID=135208 RepID=A0A4Y9ZXV2_9AGAM|nr:hypothetical protein EWM64_g5683 [Hericium alpestre]
MAPASLDSDFKQSQNGVLPQAVGQKWFAVFVGQKVGVFAHRWEAEGMTRGIPHAFYDTYDMQAAAYNNLLAARHRGLVQELHDDDWSDVVTESDVTPSKAASSNSLWGYYHSDATDTATESEYATAPSRSSVSSRSVKPAPSLNVSTTAPPSVTPVRKGPRPASSVPAHVQASSAAHGKSTLPPLSVASSPSIPHTAVSSASVSQSPTRHPTSSLYSLPAQLCGLGLESTSASETDTPHVPGSFPLNRTSHSLPVPPPRGRVRSSPHPDIGVPPAPEPRSMPAQETRSAPAQETRFAPAQETRSVPAGETRSAPTPYTSRALPRDTGAVPAADLHESQAAGIGAMPTPDNDVGRTPGSQHTRSPSPPRPGSAFGQAPGAASSSPPPTYQPHTLHFTYYPTSNTAYRQSTWTYDTFQSLSGCFGMEPFESRKFYAVACGLNPGIYPTCRTTKLWFLKYGWVLPLEEDAAVELDDPPETNLDTLAFIGNTNKLDEDTIKARQATYSEKISNWFCHHGKKLVKAPENGAADSFVINAALAPPRREAAWQVYSTKYYDSRVKASVDEQYAAIVNEAARLAGTMPVDKFKFQTELTRQKYGLESEEIKEEIHVIVEANYSAVMAEYKQLSQSPKTAEEYHKTHSMVLQHLQPVVDNISRQYGMVACLLLSGLILQDRGAIGSLVIHSGLTEGLVRQTWAAFNKASFDAAAAVHV